MKEILTKKHNYWEGFSMRLKDALDNPQNDNRGCHDDLRHTTKILKSLPGIDVEKTIEYFEDRGGCCDCEVLTNV
jgi:hypothetical protein